MSGMEPENNSYKNILLKEKSRQILIINNFMSHTLIARICIFKDKISYEHIEFSFSLYSAVPLLSLEVRKREQFQKNSRNTKVSPATRLTDNRRLRSHENRITWLVQKW